MCETDWTGRLRVQSYSGLVEGGVPSSMRISHSQGEISAKTMRSSGMGMTCIVGCHLHCMTSHISEKPCKQVVGPKGVVYTGTSKGPQHGALRQNCGEGMGQGYICCDDTLRACPVR